MHHTKIFEQINGHPQYVNEKSANLLNEQFTHSHSSNVLLHKYVYISDFRLISNFAGAVQLMSFTCIPNFKKIHITLLPFSM